MKMAVHFNNTYIIPTIIIFWFNRGHIWNNDQTQLFLFPIPLTWATICQSVTFLKEFEKAKSYDKIEINSL